MTITQTEPDTQSKNLRFVVNRTLNWHGKKYERGDDLNVSPTDKSDQHVQAWIEHKWISEMRDGEKATPLPPAKPQSKKPALIELEVLAPIGRHGERLKKGDRFMIKRSSSRVHVDRWISQGKLREVQPDAEPIPRTVSRALVAAAIAAESADGGFQVLDTTTVAPGTVNPRKLFDEEYMVEMTESVRGKGVLQPLIVRPMPPGQWFLDPGRSGKTEGWFMFDRRRFFTRKDPFSGSYQDYHHLPPGLMEYFFLTREEAEAAIPKWEIIAGECRWRAARRASLAAIPAVIKDVDDEQAAEIQVIENEQRKNLSPLETAAGYRHLLDLPGYSMEKLVKRVGKAANTLYSKLKLLDLPEPLQQAVARKELGTVTAERLGRLKGDIQVRAAALILKGEVTRDDQGKVSDREAQEIIEKLKHEQEHEELQQAAREKAEAEGYQVLEGERARGVIAYSDQLAHNCGYVAVGDACPHDPQGRTWNQMVAWNKEAIQRSGGIEVRRLAVIALSNREGYKAVPIYARDEVNALLKHLDLWDAEGSTAAREREEKSAARERHGIAREAMMQDLDAIRRHVEKERSPRRALLAAVWAFTDEVSGDIAGVEFVAKRRLWMSLDDKTGDANSIVRSLGSDLEDRELQALVVELAIAQMDDEEKYFARSREEIRGLVEMDTAPPRSASARTQLDPGEVEEERV